MSDNKAGPSAPYPTLDVPPSYEASMNQSFCQATQSNSGYKAGSCATEPSQGCPPPMAAAGVSPPVVVIQCPPPSFGTDPITMMCPKCQCYIQTSIISEPGPMAWILSAVLCVVGCWPCALVPCCFQSLNVVTHKCPQCRAYLGRYTGGI